MKKILDILMTGAFVLAMASCSGTIDPDDGDNNSEIKGPFTLSVSKTEIEADGKDVAKLILTDANGNVLTDTKQLDYMTFEEQTTGSKLSRTNEFTAIQNGEYTFTATYKKYKSENSVTVKAKNRVAYEKYYRKVAIYDMTDVDCVFCPNMVSHLNNVPDIYKEKMVVLALHGGFKTNDPWNLGISNNLFSAFGGMKIYPFLIINLNDTYQQGNVNNSLMIAEKVETHLRKYPATCGIKVSNVLTEKGDLEINASLTSDKGGSYDLCYAVVKDNCKYIGGTMPNDTYDDVVIGLSGNYMKLNAEKVFTVKAGEEHSEQWPMEMSKASEKITSSNKSEFRVVVLALRSLDGKAFIDNVVECPIDSSVDYVLNK